MFHYAYILRSESFPERHYVGSTSDLNARLAAHNAGKVRHTSKYKPWRVETAIAMRSKEKTCALERYLELIRK